uniref:Uncharacterized protein n=1 Tax=Cacopsylla melanoneura TaxID=428564 RepID=A0A8D9EPQ6_9HEMI
MYDDIIILSPCHVYSTQYSYGCPSRYYNAMDGQPLAYSLGYTCAVRVVYSDKPDKPLIIYLIQKKRGPQDCQPGKMFKQNNITHIRTYLILGSYSYRFSQHKLA